MEITCAPSIFNNFGPDLYPAPFAQSITTFNPYAANSNARKLNSSTDLAITTISVNTNKLYLIQC